MMLKKSQDELSGTGFGKLTKEGGSGLPKPKP